jgi:enoyl-CoA hydratase/carnithine racemase
MLTADIHPDGIATLRLGQPERRNALSIAMRDALEAWATDNRVRVVILTAAGSSFCAGFDLCLLCDVPIATPNAVFAHPGIKFGTPPLFTPCSGSWARVSRGSCASRVGASMRKRDGASGW